jgi:hypothetical protein
MGGVTFIESFIISSTLCPSGVSISPNKYSSSSLMFKSVLASSFSLKVLFGKARTLSSTFQEPGIFSPLYGFKLST